jgi:hypothetical protein
MTRELSRFWWAGFLLLWVGLNPVPANAGDTHRSLISSIKSNLLFEKLGLSCEATEPTASWQVYDLGDTVGGIRVGQVCLALFPSVRSAEQGMRRRILSTMTVAPRDLPRPVGDQCMVWASVRGGTFFFRRINVVTEFTWQGELSGALALAEKADNIIARDEEVAPRGAAAPQPNQFGFVRPDDSGLTDVVRRPLYVPPGHSLPGRVPLGDHTTPSQKATDQQPGSPPEELTGRKGNSAETADSPSARGTPGGSQAPRGVVGAASDFPKRRTTEDLHPASVVEPSPAAACSEGTVNTKPESVSASPDHTRNMPETEPIPSDSPASAATPQRVQGSPTSGGSVWPYWVISVAVVTVAGAAVVLATRRRTRGHRGRTKPRRSP